MNTSFSHRHSIDSLAALLLFALFILFLLFMLLFGAGSYQASVRGLDTGNNLYTAASYITTKFRQHDQTDSISVKEFQGTTALCFCEDIEGKDYFTYIYLYEDHLKELFTAADSGADLSMGTSLAELSDFTVDTVNNSFYKISLTDQEGTVSSFWLHPGVPSSDPSIP